MDNHIRRLDQDLKRFEAELKAAGIDSHAGPTGDGLQGALPTSRVLGVLPAYMADACVTLAACPVHAARVECRPCTKRNCVGSRCRRPGRANDVRLLLRIVVPLIAHDSCDDAAATGCAMEQCATHPACDHRYGVAYCP